MKKKRDRALLAILLACEAVDLNSGHIQQREEHGAIVDLKGKAGHTRTIPMPAWVKDVLDKWLKAANITSGKLFRRVHKIGKAWGDGLAEKAVWHVVREYAGKAGIEKLAPHGLRRTGLATPREANWSRSSFCSVTFPFRRQNDTWVANSGFAVPSTTRSG